MVRLLVGLLLVLWVSGCAWGGGPPTAVVADAIATQLQQSRQELAQTLKSDPGSSFQITAVTITQRRSTTVAGQPALQVRGTYTLTGRYLNNSLKQPDNPFEIYLSRTPDGEAWQLLRPIAASTDTDPSWVVAPLS
ncbi:uncharacterized protein XM38_036430 [Halomicronema hongdechloris C2206]|uniref:ARC6 IMS domain-containing protein n=1 Tax=Halomicronema hongdechloris C2206 TaxID=1641165 RepID=A0A1Z3HQX2_9CYAN|nr:hypothetical protein [Halomicronema hongdechloris]ASC72685.1 uncharacterized protein XM38_036430 [Halomicronema hongdechloris C2206]